MENYTEKTAAEKLQNLPEWKFNNNGIEKNFSFKNFRDAMAFMLRVSYICEEKNHHPEWSNVYNKVHVRFSTHTANGLTNKDFEVAGEIEKII